MPIFIPFRRTEERVPRNEHQETSNEYRLSKIPNPQSKIQNIIKHLGSSIPGNLAFFLKARRDQIIPDLASPYVEESKIPFKR